MNNSNLGGGNNLIATALKIYKKTPFKYKAIEFFKSKGIPEEEHENLYTQLHEAYINDRISFYTKRNLAIWVGCIILFLLCIWFFYFYIPKTSWRNNPFWVAVLGSGLLMLLLFHIVGFFGLWSNEKAVRERIEKKVGFNLNYSFLFIMLFPAIIPYFIFSSRYKNEIENQLIINGIETEAKVVNGWSKEIRSRRGRIEEYYIMVEFKDKSGKKLEATKEVYKGSFNKYYKGQHIMIVYDSLNTEKIELLDNAQSIRKFTRAEERNLSANDLFEILEMNDVDAILEKLNQISPGWINKKNFYINERRMEKIELIDNEAIGYSAKSLAFESAINSFEKGEYEKIEAEKQRNPFEKSNLYENDKYMIEVQRKTVTNPESYDSYIFTIISIIKKQ